MPQSHSIQWDESLPPFSGFGSQYPPDGYAIEAMAKGTKFGNPEAILEVVKSLLSDGSLAVLEGWDNREVSIRLRLSAPTAIAGPALAEAEKALMLALQAQPKAPLVYVPIAQDSATCVFDVIAAQLERDNDDDWTREESLREYRYYMLTLTCGPFARPPDTVVVPALPAPPASPTTVLIDDCASVTGWSALTDSNGPTTLTSTSGEVRATGSWSSSGAHSLTLSRTGSVTMGSTPHLRVRMAFDYTGRKTGPTATLTANTGTGPVTPLEVVATAPSTEVPGMTDYYFKPPASFTKVSFVVTGPSTGRSYDIWTNVAQIDRTNTIPGSGTLRQQARVVTVAGSAPTQATIRLWDASAALGDDILVHTSRNTAWRPPLRPWRTTSSTVTADSALVSGAQNTLAAPMVFQIPASYFTHGTYALMARVGVAASGTLSWTASMIASGPTGLIGRDITTSGSVTVPATPFGGAAFRVFALGAPQLPVLAVEDDQLIKVTLTGTSSMAVDEAWLFGLTDGALTWIADNEMAVQWMEIRSPDLGDPRPAIFGGTGAVGNDSVSIDWMGSAFGAHRFDPGMMQIFTVTRNTLNSRSELEFYPRYHSHVEGSSA